MLLWIFLLPGDLVCNAAGVPADSDYRQVLRSFVNMAIWAAVSIAAALWLAM